MADGELGRPHFLVRGRVKGREYSAPPGGGDPKVRDVEFRAHGEAMRDQLGSTIEEVRRLRDEEALGGEELRALGSTIVLEASDTAFPLKLESLEQVTRGGKKKAPRPKKGAPDVSVGHVTVTLPGSGGHNPPSFNIAREISA